MGINYWGHNHLMILKRALWTLFSLLLRTFKLWNVNIWSNLKLSSVNNKFLKKRVQIRPPPSLKKKKKISSSTKTKYTFNCKNWKEYSSIWVFKLGSKNSSYTPFQWNLLMLQHLTPNLWQSLRWSIFFGRWREQYQMVNKALIHTLSMVKNRPFSYNKINSFINRPVNHNETDMYIHCNDRSTTPHPNFFIALIFKNLSLTWCWIYYHCIWYYFNMYYSRFHVGYHKEPDEIRTL